MSSLGGDSLVDEAVAAPSNFLPSVPSRPDLWIPSRDWVEVRGRITWSHKRESRFAPLVFGSGEGQRDPGEADQLRRAMGAWRKTGIIEKFRVKLLSGMAANGYTAEFAERLYNQICGFGQYGFPESHAASFALLVYASAWIKCYHPGVFLASLLNSQPMGFYGPSQLVTDARRHGVEVRPVDVHRSEWQCTLEKASGHGFAVRLGWRMVNGMSEANAELITSARAAAPFTSYHDFARRTGLQSNVLATLARANVFLPVENSRRQAVWQSLASRDPAPLFEGLPETESVPPLPPMTGRQEMCDDYQTTGLSFQAHPLSFLREKLKLRGILPTSSLGSQIPDRRYSVAGLIILRQRPGTAKGITFMTLEDETGTTNLIVRIEIWERFHKVARHAAGMIVSGRLQNQHNVIHLVVDTMEDLTRTLEGVDPKARDFR